jgi:hypothetical protein
MNIFKCLPFLPSSLPYTEEKCSCASGKEKYLSTFSYLKLRAPVNSTTPRPGRRSFMSEKCTYDERNYFTKHMFCKISKITQV